MTYRAIPTQMDSSRIIAELLKLFEVIVTSFPFANGLFLFRSSFHVSLIRHFFFADTLRINTIKCVLKTLTCKIQQQTFSPAIKVKARSQACKIFTSLFVSLSFFLFLCFHFHSLPLFRFAKKSDSVDVSFIPWEEARLFTQSLVSDLAVDSSEYINLIIRTICPVFLSTVNLLIKASSTQAIPPFVSLFLFY